MKNKRLLWASLFLLVFLLGVLRGVFLSLYPSSRQYDESIHILNQNPDLFPPEVIDQIEKDIQASIVITNFKNLIELNSLIIAQEKYSLIVADEQVIDTLNNQNFTERIDTVLNSEIHPDFVQQDSENKSFFLPIFWQTYDYLMIDANKPIQFPKYLDLIYTDYIKNNTSITVDLNQIKNKLSLYPTYEVIQKKLDTQFNYLVPHTKSTLLLQLNPLYKINNTDKVKFISKHGFGILRYKPNRALAFAFIHSYLKDKVQYYLSERFNFASTLKISENLQNEFKKAKYLRSLDFINFNKVQKAPIEWENEFE